MNIAGRLVGAGHPCYLIADGGVNHNGDVEIAKRLIGMVARAGADACKFQRRDLSALLSQQAAAQPYSGPFSFGATYRAHRAALELPDEAWRTLLACAKAEGVTLLASAWDEPSVAFVDWLGLPAIKLPSAGLTDLRLLRAAAQTGRPLLISTGMSDLAEVAQAVAAVAACPEVVLLHCCSSYPAEYADINLRVMDTLRQFGRDVGYSGHERGLAPSLAAVAMGACVVERHVTMDRTLPGPDHAASLEPKGLALLVRDVRHIEAAMGERIKRVLEVERPIRAKLGKSLVATRFLPARHRLTTNDLAAKSPGTGISPAREGDLVGRVTPQAVAPDTLFPLEALEWPTG